MAFRIGLLCLLNHLKRPHINGSIDNSELLEAQEWFNKACAISKGYNFVIISGGTQDNVKKRLNSLGVEDVFLNAFDKLKIFNDYISKNNISLDNIK